MNASLYTDTFSTPCGPFSVAVTADGAVAATAFGPVSALRARLTSTRRSQPLTPDKVRTAIVRAQVTDYFAGKRKTFDLPLAAGGTAFQRKVWTALQRLPFGATASYGQLAAKLRLPRAARAVGRANATNPICLIVPCHRVIGADGSLTGFAFGETIKRRLLEHEGAMIAE